MADLTNRMIRAAKLDAGLYEEVEADKNALVQSMSVVLLSSIAIGFGSSLRGGLGVMMVSMIAALIGWYVWAVMIYVIGTRILPEKQTEADVGQLLRAIGFSSAPGVLGIFGFVPGVGALVLALVQIWMLAAMVVAVRQALDYTGTGRAIGVCVIGWIVQVLVLALIIAVLGVPAASVPA